MVRILGTTGPLPDGFAGGNLARGTGAALGAGSLSSAVVETAVRGVRPRWQEWLLSDNAAVLVLGGGQQIYVNDGGFVDDAGQFVDSGR